jgi:hypothetical protein
MSAASTGSVRSGETRADRLPGLRGNSFGALVILLVQYGLGIWVNLYAHIPATDRGANVASGFARAISNGPVGLSVHAVLGVILIASAAAALVRAFLVRRTVLIAAAAAGLICIVTAGFSGAAFVGNGGNAASMSMAIAAGVAIFAYALILFRSAAGLYPASTDAAATSARGG